MSLAKSEESLLYMVIESFHGGDPRPIYERLRDRGRMFPGGLEYVASWVREDLAVCYQVMRSPERRVLDAWIEQWSDIVDFEVVEVLESASVQSRVAPMLRKPGGA